MVPIASESVVNLRIGEISWPVIRCNSCLLRTSRKKSCDQIIVALDHQNGWTYRDVFFIGFKMFKSSEEDDTCTVFSQEKVILKGNIDQHYTQLSHALG